MLPTPLYVADKVLAFPLTIVFVAMDTLDPAVAFLPQSPATESLKVMYLSALFKAHVLLKILVFAIQGALVPNVNLSSLQSSIVMERTTRILLSALAGEHVAQQIIALVWVDTLEIIVRPKVRMG
jgi:hypothetical protein